MPAPLIVADFDYFRLPRSRWGLTLWRLRQMGLHALWLTIPWGFHEMRRGTIDLDGATDPRRDLLGLLDRCAALEFHCLLDLSPPAHSGLLNDGRPYWLPGDPDGAAAKAWYGALGQALAGWQWPNGPIIALHVAEEVHQPTHDRQLTQVKWPIWLRKRYHGIEALNVAYGTAYRSVSEVKFPELPAAPATPVERDAQEFLAETEGESQEAHRQLLAGTGWQISVYTPAEPHLTRYTLTGVPPAAFEAEAKIIRLEQPIEIDPDPVDVGTGPVWAIGAPIRSDGSLRRKFWAIRRLLWQQALPAAQVQGETLTLLEAAGGLVTSGGDTLLQIPLAEGAKPSAFRLRLNGSLVPEEGLKVARRKLSGLYRAEDELDQTDLILFLHEPSAPLTGFLRAYRRDLLLARAEQLAYSAKLAEKLGESLTEATPPPQPPAPRHPSYTLQEVERGLKEADAALRKAVASIGGLEEGFATILNKPTPPPLLAQAPLPISPAIFEGAAREILLRLGELCRTTAPQLEAAAATLRTLAETPTLEQYPIITATATARTALLEVIAELRLGLAAERLPLLLWRVHDQAQEIAEGLPSV
jgi:hypothetical protein